MRNEKLYIARKENRLKQKDLAKKINVSEQTYSRKEKGKDFTQTEMIMLAKIFNCTLNDLFWEETK